MGNKAVTTQALLDSGAGGRFIHPKFVIRHRILTQKLQHPIPVFNVDNTPNKEGTITEEVHLPVIIGNDKRTLQFYVTGIGREDIILGLPWLQDENPKHIDWKTGRIELRPRMMWQKLREIYLQRKQQIQPVSVRDDWR